MEYQQSIERLFQCIQKFEPSLSLNTEVSQDVLYNILNNMSRKFHNIVYDYDTFLELYQRAQQLNMNVTIYTFLEVHLQAVDILNSRVINQQQDLTLLKNFTQQINTFLRKPNDSYMNRMVNGQSLNINRIIISGNDAYQFQPQQIRLIDEAQQTESFFNLRADSQGFVCLPNQRIAINNLYQQFTLEVFDQYNSIAYATLSVYHLNISNSNPVKLFVYFVDQIKRDLTITVEGQIEITNQDSANQDLLQLRDEEVRLSQELTSTQEQLRSLNFPFDTTQASYHQPSHQASFVQGGGYPNTLAQNNNPQFYNDAGFAAGAQLHQTNQHVVQGGIMHTSTNEECDFDSKSLVRNIHYLLIIYLIAAIIFCVKRSMFLDATIAISFLAVLHRSHQLQNKIPEVLKVFIGLFALTTALDLAWLIVYFPSWNRDNSSEDQGAQGALRIVILGGSLLFMIYKVLLIVAVFFLQKDFIKQQEVVQKSIENFLIGNEFTRTSHNGTQPNMSSKPFH